MTRAVLGLREKGNQLFHTVYKLIRKCIEIDQEFTAEMKYEHIFNSSLFVFNVEFLLVKMK